MDGYEPEAHVVLGEAERHARADAFIAALGVKIETGGDEAYYRPSTDTVRLPHFSRFRTRLHFTEWPATKFRMHRERRIVLAAIYLAVSARLFTPQKRLASSWRRDSFWLISVSRTIHAQTTQRTFPRGWKF